MTTFCSGIYSNKRIIKCVSLLDKKCYVFIGTYQDRFVIETIKTDINSNNPFLKIENMKNGEDKLKRLYTYLTDEETEDLDEIKREVIDILFIPNCVSFFIDELIYEDDTNEKVLMKISEYCYNASEPTPSKYIFSFYETFDNKILSLNIDYPDNNFETNIIEGKPCDLIDTKMIDKNGEQKLIEKKNMYH